GRKHARRYRQVVRRPDACAECGAQLRERTEVVVVAVDVLDPVSQPGEGIFVLAAVLRNGCASPLDELIPVPTGLRHADNWKVQAAATCHRLKGGKDVLVRKVAGGAKKYESIRAFGRHRCALSEYSGVESVGVPPVFRG